jgi:hypothetical protein
MGSLRNALIGTAYPVRILHTTERRVRRDHEMPSVKEVPCRVLYAVIEVDEDYADWQADRLAATHQGGLHIYDTFSAADAVVEAN